MAQKASKTNDGHHFEDLEVGRKLVHAVPRTITEGNCTLDIALMLDRHPLHSSIDLANALGYGEGLPVNDMLVINMGFGKTVDDVSLNATANRGYARLRRLGPVYCGDTISMTSEVVGRKQNSRREDGIVWVHSVGTNQQGDMVLEYYRWVQVRMREPGKVIDGDVIPEMPKEVPPKDLVVPGCLDVSGDRLAVLQQASGGKYFLGDYEVGERICHIDGMRVEEADHMLATRLFQNTSRVHFDPNVVERDTPFDRPVVYGGFVVGRGYAASFRGFENSLGILAWNGGEHCSPTFAGDILYFWSEVLDVVRLGNGVGALRVRLIGAKVDPTREEVPIKVEGEKRGQKVMVYNPNVVLDLDYWLMMPERPQA